MNASDSKDWRQHFLIPGEDTSQYKQALIDCAAQIADLFSTLSTPYSGHNPEDLRIKLQHALPTGESGSQQGIGIRQAIGDVLESVGRHCIIAAHPHCVAHLHTPPLLPALAAEMILTAINPSLDSWDQSAAATLVEQQVVDWLCSEFGFPAAAGGTFTSGGTQSNLLGLLLARNEAVERHFHVDAQEDGLPTEAQRLRILCSVNSHFSIQKSAALLGMGKKAVISIGEDQHGRLCIHELRAAIEQLRKNDLIPCAIVATAGTTDLGAIDPLGAVAECAREQQIWLHIDAAYGGALIFSQPTRLAGIELADSLTVDFHKLFFQPISCGVYMVRDRSRFRHLLHHAPYLNRETDDLPNLVEQSLSTTRRFDALKVVMSILALGRETLGEMIDRTLLLAKAAARLIDQQESLQLVAAPQLSTVLFRYVGPRSTADLDQLQQKLRLELLATGEAVIGETQYHGQRVLKLTILNPCLTEEMLQVLLVKINDAARRLNGS